MTRKAVIVWFRADLRINDHPALAAAVKDASSIIPLFIFDDVILSGKFSSSNRNRFLLECLEDLKKSLKSLGGDLIIRRGVPVEELLNIAQQTKAQAVYYSADYTPYAITRDKLVERTLQDAGIEARSFGGKLAVNSLQKVVTKNGEPYKVFTPFWKAWSEVSRRELAPVPSNISLPDVTYGELPSLHEIIKEDVSEDVIKGGETEGRERLHTFLDGPIASYKKGSNDLGSGSTSRLSAYLHFGCLSVREIETMIPDSEGARAWHRQLAWREFYYYVLFHFPHPEREFQERYRHLEWDKNERLFEAWREGKTGYPIVDAGMRQLKAEGWMHNRARLVVGSFLTKDLGINWREGEKHFMKWLIDGDMANNNGNWQWIGSVGVDPAPLFRRLYNPISQQERYDPDGLYVRKYVPELKKVSAKYLSQPWTMSDEEQQRTDCIIGKDYPGPIVNHKEARERALERYNAR